MRVLGTCRWAAAVLVLMLGCGSNDPATGDPSGSGETTGGATTGGMTTGGSTTGGSTTGGSTPPPDTTAEVFGPVYSGSYNDGPVDYAETAFHNACASGTKYAPQIQQLYGPYLAGVDNSLGGDGSLCDACALVTTRLGKSVLVHIVTYGVSMRPGDLDLSPEAYQVIHEDDPMGTSALPRPMSWQLARCPDKGNMVLEFQTAANPYWTSFWVRNAKLPIASVESKKAGESAFSMLKRTPDGPFTDADGVGSGAFDLRITSTGNQTVTATLTGFQPGAIVESSVQFP